MGTHKNDPETCGECEQFHEYDIEYECEEDICGMCLKYNELTYANDFPCDDPFSSN